jgi:hypothetical protein
MKGDYSQPGLMPGRYLAIDLPSAYLVYAVGSRLRRKLQLLPGGASFRTDLPKSAALLPDLAEFAVLIENWTSSVLLRFKFWLDSLKHWGVDRRLEDRSLNPQMPLSLHIAQGNAGRVAGGNRPAKLPGRISVLRPHCGLSLLSEHGARVTNNKYMKARRETHHHPRRFINNPSPSHRQ